jgi:hypothetical protein
MLNALQVTEDDQAWQAPGRWRALSAGHFGQALYCQVMGASLHQSRDEEGALGRLGRFPDVSSRRMRDKASAMVRSGIDPIDDRERQRAGTSASRPSFDECAKKFIEAHEPSWRNAKHRQQWDHTLRDYASPVFGAMPVEVITTEHVLEALKPLWIKKPETASRVRQRIERVMDFAKVHGYRQGENPARWRGHLDNLLPAPTKIAKVKHFAAMSYDDVPIFVARLRERSDISSAALQFTILTAVQAKR